MNDFILWGTQNFLFLIGAALFLFISFLIMRKRIDRALRYERTKMIEDILKIVNGRPEAGGYHPQLTYRSNKLIADEFERRLEYLHTKRKNATY